MSPFMIALNVVCAIILVLYIVHKVYAMSRSKKIEAAKKDAAASEKVIVFNDNDVKH